MRRFMTAPLAVVLLLLVTAVQARPATTEEGFLTTPDGVRLFYQKVGNGPQTVILPGGLFLYPDLATLADSGRTLIFYDMRNRGRSQSIEDLTRVTIQADVRDLEAVRSHFKAEKIVPVGWSYLGLMVVMYAMDHPERVERIVQMGAVPRKYGTEYPPRLVNNDTEQFAPQELRSELRRLRDEGYDKSHPKEYCDKYYDYIQLLVVGDPANADKVRKPCEYPNEWPVNFFKHLEAHFVNSVQKLDLPVAEVKKVSVPVLTIHGTRDRNAPYGAGREWALTLPGARLITVEGAAHEVWVDAPWVLQAIDVFLHGKWPERAEKIRSL